MPRKKISTKMPGIRKKCFACGKIKLVKYREWKLPEPKYSANTTKLPNREDIPGASVKNYGCYPNFEDGTFECGYSE